MAVCRPPGDMSLLATTIGSLDMNAIRQASAQAAGMFNQISSNLRSSALVDSIGRAAKHMSSDNFLHKLKSAEMQVRHQWDPLAVQTLQSAEDFMAANDYMRRAIMSDPWVMQQFRTGELEGWDGDFTMTDQNLGVDNYDYRRRMSGMVQMDQSNSWEVTQWYDVTDEMTFEEKVIVNESVNCALSRITAMNRDATSYFNTKL